MRICRLDLIAFGPFENVSLDLSAGNRGLHLIYGDNEDGKSTSLRAIRGLLFGIDERTKDVQRFKPSQLRIGARLRNDSGQELAVVRRKGRKDTLLSADSDELLADAALLPYLGDLSAQVFSTLHGIDHQELISGGKNILDQKGEVGKAIYSAATGTASLKKVLDELEQSATQLFKPRAGSTRIMAAVNELKAQLNGAKKAAVPSSDWTKLLQALEEAERERKAAEDDRRRLKRELMQRERVKRVRPTLAQRAQLLADLEALGEVVDLPATFEQDRRDAADLMRTAQDRLAQIAATLERLTTEEQGAQLPSALLEHASSIEALLRKLGAYETAQKDRPAQDAKRRQHTNDARELVAAIRPDLDVKDVESMRPLLVLEQSIRGLVSSHEKLDVEEQRAERTCNEAQANVEALRREHEQAAEVADPAKLAEAVKMAQQAGGLDEQVNTAQDRCERKQHQCGLEVDRLGLWKGTAEELERTPLPGGEAVAQFETGFQEFASRIASLDDKLREVTAQQQDVESNLDALVRGGEVPTADELLERRAHRDDGWSLVRRQCFDREDVDEEVRRFASARPLPDVYEDAVRSADDVADRLRTDADRVQRREALETDRTKAKQKLESLRAERQERGQGQEVLQQTWEQLWAPVGIEPRSPREMATWLRKAEGLRQHLEELRDIQRDRGALVARRDALEEMLGAALTALGESLDERSETLGAMLERAQHVLDGLHQGLTRKRDLEKALQTAESTLARATEEQKAIAGRRGAWKREWAEVLRDFVFLSEPGVARVLATLDQLQALFRAVDKANEMTRRVYGIDKVLSDFEAELDRFAEAVGRPREAQPVDEYVEGLNSGLTQVRELDTRLKGLRRQREELGNEKPVLNVKVGSANARLAELRTLAQVDSDDALLDAGQRSSRARALREQIAQREQQALDAGDGQSIDELREQVEGVDGDELGARIAELTEELQQAEQRFEEVVRREAELKQRIATMSGEATAAEASERAEQALSQLREDVRTYLRLRTATLILKNQIELYRQKNQGPILRRAGELFAQLTLKSFTGLRDEVDGAGQPILLGVRDDGQEVSVEGMSDGTRDQLYLALRLATLELHLARGERIPFIVDDILVGFDDARTEACLRVLCSLASETQVLLFTHHKRVVEIAASLGDGSGVIEHRLGWLSEA